MVSILPTDNSIGTRSLTIAEILAITSAKSEWSCIKKKNATCSTSHMLMDKAGVILQIPWKDWEQQYVSPFPPLFVTPSLQYI